MATTSGDNNAQVKAHYDSLLGTTYTCVARGGEGQPIPYILYVATPLIASTTTTTPQLDDGRRRAQLGGEREALPPAWAGAGRAPARQRQGARPRMRVRSVPRERACASRVIQRRCHH